MSRDTIFLPRGGYGVGVCTSSLAWAQHLVQADTTSNRQEGCICCCLVFLLEVSSPLSDDDGDRMESTQRMTSFCSVAHFNSQGEGEALTLLLPSGELMYLALSVSICVKDSILEKIPYRNDCAQRFYLSC